MSEEQSSSTAKTDFEMNLSNTLPTGFPVSVVLESRPAVSEWIDVVWKAIAVTIGSRDDEISGEPRLVRSEGEVKHYLCSGLQVKLFKDECDSYYQNLLSDTPRCYVVAHTEDIEDAPDPFLITMSFDEAHAYLEGEDQVYDVDIPPELYKWTEAYILVHYAPQQRKKRKRKDWSKTERDNVQ